MSMNQTISLIKAYSHTSKGTWNSILFQPIIHANSIRPQKIFYLAVKLKKEKKKKTNQVINS